MTDELRFEVRLEEGERHPSHDHRGEGHELHEIKQRLAHMELQLKEILKRLPRHYPRTATGQISVE